MATRMIAKRNIRLFVRDRNSVMFSLLAVFVVLVLYLLFLGDVWAGEIVALENPKILMNEWIVAGLVTITGVTTTLGAFAVMVDDKAKKIAKDFYSAPMKRTAIVEGYVISTYLIGLSMSLFAFVLGEIYIVISGGTLLSPLSVCKVIAISALNTLASTAMMLFMLTFVESVSAFASISIVIGTLIGFLTGMYLPIGRLPEGVQFVMKLFPISYSAGLLREVMMQDTLTASFAGIPEEFLISFQKEMGNIFMFRDFTITNVMSVLILLVTTAVFMALSVLRYSRKKR